MAEETNVSVLNSKSYQNENENDSLLKLDGQDSLVHSPRYEPASEHFSESSERPTVPETKIVHRPVMKKESERIRYLKTMVSISKSSNFVLFDSNEEKNNEKGGLVALTNLSTGTQTRLIHSNVACQSEEIRKQVAYTDTTTKDSGFIQTHHKSWSQNSSSNQNKNA